MAQNKSYGNTVLTIVITALIFFFVGFFVGRGVKPDNGKKMPARAFNQVSQQQNAIHDQYEMQLSVLKKEVVGNPENGEAWTKLGNLYFDHGEAEQSIESYKKSLEINPNNANVWTDLGVMYRRNKEFKSAINAFLKANEIAPKHEVALLNTGIVLLYDLKDTAGAVAAWENLVKLNENASTNTGQLITDILQSVKH